MAPEARYLCVNDAQPIEHARRLAATGIGREACPIDNKYPPRRRARAGRPAMPCSPESDALSARVSGVRKKNEGKLFR